MVKKIAYIFPGQGAQYVGMGKDLYDISPAGKDIFDKANKILGFDLCKLCFDGPQEKLSATSMSQPAILTTSIAFLAGLKENFPSLKPSIVLGLSLGEYSALVAAGAMEFGDALKLVYSRGLFMEDASNKNPGKMACIIGMDIKSAEGVCSSCGTEIANLNSPGQIVISGKNGAIAESITLASKKGAKKTVVLDVSGPFHSSLMNEASVRLREILRDVKIAVPSVPVISNVNALAGTSENEIKENLVNQVNHRTRWEESVREAAKSGVDTFLEIGPGKVLKGLLRRIDPGLKVYNVGTVKDIEELRKCY